MRVILEVISGSTAGRKVCLTADQELRVGRTEWADFAVPQDSLMSGVHFALQSDISGCYLTDLGSSNGTLVNGQPVDGRTLLGAGDEILAGETRFAVHVEQELGVSPGGVARPSPAAAGFRPSVRGQRQCPSAVTATSGSARRPVRPG